MRAGGGEQRLLTPECLYPKASFASGQHPHQDLDYLQCRTCPPSSSSGGPRDSTEHSDSSSLEGFLKHLSDRRKFGMWRAKDASLTSVKRSCRAGQQLHGLRRLCRSPSDCSWHNEAQWVCVNKASISLTGPHASFIASFSVAQETFTYASINSECHFKAISV